MEPVVQMQGKFYGFYVLDLTGSLHYCSFFRNDIRTKRGPEVVLHFKIAWENLYWYPKVLFGIFIISKPPNKFKLSKGWVIKHPLRVILQMMFGSYLNRNFQKEYVDTDRKNEFWTGSTWKRLDNWCKEKNPGTAIFI